MGPIILIACLITFFIWAASYYPYKKVFHHKTGLYKVYFRSPTKSMHIEWKVKRCADGKVSRGYDYKTIYSETLDNINSIKICATKAIEHFLHQQELKQFRKLKDIVEL